jgi:hypothetical protein
MGMAWSRRRFAIWVCVLGTATLAIGIGVATGAKLKTRSDSTTLPPGPVKVSTGFANARCDEGTKAISGGFHADVGIEPGDPLIVPTDSAGPWNRRAWYAVGANLGDEPGELTSFAYCRDERVKQRIGEFSVEPLDSNTRTVRCPKGTRVIAGGFAATSNVSPSPLFVFESRKVRKRRWLTGAFNNSTDEDGFVFPLATCGGGVEALKTSKRKIVMDGPGVHTVSARCKPKRRVISGGFDLGILPNPDAFVFSSHKEGKRVWEASAVVNFDGPPAELKAFAYCEKR